MKCQACNRPFKSEPNMVGRYAYGPVCFSRMFPSPKRMRIKPTHVVIDTQTIDLFSEVVEQEIRSENGRIR